MKNEAVTAKLLVHLVDFPISMGKKWQVFAIFSETFIGIRGDRSDGEEHHMTSHVPTFCGVAVINVCLRCRPTQQTTAARQRRVQSPCLLSLQTP